MAEYYRMVCKSMMRLLVAVPLLALSGLLSPGDAIITRHDRDDARYLELGQRYAPTLVALNLQAPGDPPDGHGVLIAERWVLTAAHVAAELDPGHSVTIAGEHYQTALVLLHPAWTGGATHDIALVRLAVPVHGVTPVTPYAGDDEVGRAVVVVGRGDTGTGLSGPTGNDRQVRGASNRVVGANAQLLWWPFDAPGDTAATDLEGISGPGDSGGPALLDIDGRVYVAGISSSQSTSATGGREGVYGVTEYYVRVSRYRGWIQRTMAAADESSKE